MTVEGERVIKATEYRIDEDHSNPLREWKGMGSPAKPSSDQLQQLKKCAQVNAKEVQAVGEGVRVMMSPNTAVVLVLKTERLSGI